MSSPRLDAGYETPAWHLVFGDTAGLVGSGLRSVTVIASGLFASVSCGRQGRLRAACQISVLALGVVLSACAPGQGPRPLPKVEAVFDTPREYRILGTLPCAEGAGLVYVVSDTADLYSFRPDTLEFALVGRLDCRAPRGARPNSMAVDRSGTAWLVFGDGSLYRASTRDASCHATDYMPGQHGFYLVGMAYASTGADLLGETLFVWGGRGWGGPSERDLDEPDTPERPELLPGLGLARLDPAELSLQPVGDDRQGLGAVRGELTGTGDGRLYGFFATHPATLAEIDVATGATRSPQRLLSLYTGHAWAFSSWGGDFWFYTARYGDNSSVTKLSGSSGLLSTVVADAGFVIVGAGVSTCAPTGPG